MSRSTSRRTRSAASTVPRSCRCRLRRRSLSGDEVEVAITLRNSGTRTWSPTGSFPHRLGKPESPGQQHLGAESDRTTACGRPRPTGDGAGPFLPHRCGSAHTTSSGGWSRRAWSGLVMRRRTARSRFAAQSYDRSRSSSVSRLSGESSGCWDSPTVGVRTTPCLRSPKAQTVQRSAVRSTPGYRHESHCIPYQRCRSGQERGFTPPTGPCKLRAANSLLSAIRQESALAAWHNAGRYDRADRHDPGHPPC